MFLLYLSAAKNEISVAETETKQAQMKYEKDWFLTLMYMCMCSLTSNKILKQLNMFFFKYVRLILGCWTDTAFRLKHAQQEIKKKQSDLKKTEQGYQKDKSAFDDIQKNMKALEVCICSQSVW